MRKRFKINIFWYWHCGELDGVGKMFHQCTSFQNEKIQSLNCLGCGDTQKEDLKHFLLHCVFFKDIREVFIPKLVLMNPSYKEIFNDESQLMISILDPISSKLPKNYVNNWSSVTSAYELTRMFCWNMHNKREKLYSDNASWSDLMII